MAATQNYDLTILQGATFKLTATYKDAYGTGLISASNTVRMKIRQTKTNNGTLILDCASYLTVDSGLSLITLLIPAAITAGLSFTTTAYYDLELVYVDGTVSRLMQGTVTLDSEVTA